MVKLSSPKTIKKNKNKKKIIAKKECNSSLKESVILTVMRNHRAEKQEIMEQREGEKEEQKPKTVRIRSDKAQRVE